MGEKGQTFFCSYWKGGGGEGKRSTVNRNWVYWNITKQHDKPCRPFSMFAGFQPR